MKKISLILIVLAGALCSLKGFLMGQVRPGRKAAAAARPVRKEVKREYKIDIGNSSDGQVGAVLYIKAKSKKAALAKIPALHDPIVYSDGYGFECRTYLNTDNITIKNVELV